MGKKVKKKAVRNIQKEKRFTSSAKTVSEEHIPATVTVGDGVPVVKEAEVCPHLDKGIDYEKVALKVASTESHKCDDCREGIVDKRASKGRGKHSKKKAGVSKSESKSIWVCLECGHFSCGGVGFPTIPQSHAARHAKLSRHPLAVQFANPNLRWCFPCNRLIQVQTTEENGEQKDALSNIVKLLKSQSSPGPSLDVEDVWFGSGSITSEIKSVNTPSSSSDNRVGYMVRGLVNLGNTCFFNSVLQNLLAMDKLRNYFLRIEGPVGPLAASLKKLFVETNPSTGTRTVINPRTFFGCLCAKAPQFRGFQEHDSHELLRCLLDGLCTEESGIRKRSLFEDSTSPGQVPTFVDTIFGGQISSTVSCLECGHASIVYEPYLDLSLPLPTKRSSSKRIQSVSRSKKPKVPPKRQGKLRNKTNRASDSSPANSVPDTLTSDMSSTPVQSVEACGEEKVAPSCDSTQSKSVVFGGMGDKNNSVETQGNRIELMSESTIKESVMPLDNMAQLDCIKPATMMNIHDKATVDSSDLISWLGYLEPTKESTDHDIAPQHSDFSVAECNGKMKLGQEEPLQHAMEVNKQVDPLRLQEKPPLPDNSSDLPSWLDYLEPATESTDHDIAPQHSDFSVAGCNGKMKLGQEEPLWHAMEVNKQVDPLWLQEKPPLPDGLSWLDYLEPTSSSNDHDASYNEYPSGVQDSGNSIDVSWQDESHLKVQESENLLLTNKEVTSSSGGCEQEPMDFDGFGGLFDEPEVAARPAAKPLSDGVAETSFMATNTSDSDPDEVDNTDSPVSVEKCLAYFTTPELLTRTEHAWQCEQCSKVLLEQKLRLKNKLHKTVTDGGEDVIPSALSGSANDCSLPNGVKNINDGSIEGPVLGNSDEKMVLHNGNSNGSRVASVLGEGKIAVGSAILQLSQGSSSAETLSEESLTIQDTDTCGINESNDKCKNDIVQKRECKFLSRQCESDVTEDEEVGSECIKVARDASKQILINKAPPILTIHLKRFTQDARGRLSKLNGHVDFRDKIDLKPYMDPSCCRDRLTYNYRLVGVVEHSGTMKGGHYVAYVRGGAKGALGTEENEDCLWYHASDAYIREASLEEVLRCEAYILFYEEM